MSDRILDSAILERAAQIQARQAEHEAPEVWMKARRLEAIGWHFEGLDLSKPAPLDRHLYGAFLGGSPSVQQGGSTLAELVACIESWESAQAARKPDLQHPHVKARKSR